MIKPASLRGFFQTGARLRELYSHPAAAKLTVISEKPQSSGFVYPDLHWRLFFDQAASQLVKQLGLEEVYCLEKLGGNSEEPRVLEVLSRSLISGIQIRCLGIIESSPDVLLRIKSNLGSNDVVVEESIAGRPEIIRINIADKEMITTFGATKAMVEKAVSEAKKKIAIVTERVAASLPHLTFEAPTFVVSENVQRLIRKFLVTPKEGMPNCSEDICMQILAENPDNLMVLLKLAVIYIERGDFDLALPRLNQAVLAAGEISQQHPGIYALFLINLGLVCFARNDLFSVEQHFTLVHNLFPRLPHIRKFLAEAATGDYGETVKEKAEVITAVIGIQLPTSSA